MSPRPMKFQATLRRPHICQKAVFFVFVLSVCQLKATEYRIQPTHSKTVEVALRCPKHWVNEDISSDENNEIVFILPGSKVSPKRELLSVTVVTVGTYYRKTQRDRARDYLAYLEDRASEGAAPTINPVTTFNTRLYGKREVYFFPSDCFPNHLFVSIQQKDALLQIDLSGPDGKELWRRLPDLKELADSVTFRFAKRR